MTISSTYNELIDFINSNILYGSRVHQQDIKDWFKSYDLTLQDKFDILKELSDLNIQLVGLPSRKIRAILFKLLLCIEEEGEIEQSNIIDWLNQQDLDKSHYQNIINNLVDQGYKIVNKRERSQKELEEGLHHLLIDDEFGDLDDLIDSEEFQQEIEKYLEPINREYNKEYIAGFQKSKENAKEREKNLSYLLKANEGLIRKVVNQYVGLSTNSYDRDDMFQEGVRGLMRAIEKFDLDTDYALSTYAYLWIRQSILRGLENDSTTIRIPAHYRRKMLKFTKSEKELWNKYARPATTIELAEQLGKSMDEIEELRFYVEITNITTLDQMVGERGDTPLIDFIEDQNLISPEENIDYVTLYQEINELFLALLDDREADILARRFGLYDGETETLEEIGELYGVTRERIRQIEARALRKLRKSRLTKPLGEYLYVY